MKKRDEYNIYFGNKLPQEIYDNIKKSEEIKKEDLEKLYGDPALIEKLKNLLDTMHKISTSMHKI